MAVVYEEAGRMLPGICGLPKRFTLLLHDASRASFTKELKGDIENDEYYATLPHAWARRLYNRIIIRRKIVQQVVRAYKKD